MRASIARPLDSGPEPRHRTEISGKQGMGFETNAIGPQPRPSKGSARFNHIYVNLVPIGMFASNMVYSLTVSVVREVA